MEILNVEGIKKRFGKKEVLKGFSLKLNSGEILGLVGKSGSGKSVFLNILSGSIIPDEGKIEFKKENLTKKIKEFRKNIGFVYQDNTLFQEMTIEENALYFGRLYGRTKKEIIENIINISKIFGLELYMKIKVNKLSGGIARLANIFVSLIHNPEILIFDEATVGLDFVTRKVLLNYIKTINKEKKLSIIFVSHILEEVEYLCDRICILKNGKISFDKKIQGIYGDSNKNINQIFEEVMQNEYN